MTNSKEIWKPIVGYEGRYEISNMGRVKSLDRYVNNRHFEEKIMNVQKTKDGYSYVQLSRPGERHTKKIHQLVMENFTDYKSRGSDATYQIDHINGNKDDNRLENLEIVTHKENMIRAYKNNLMRNYTRKVICLDDGTIYDSLLEAAYSVGSKRSTDVGRVCKGISLHHKGKRFAYYDDYLNGTIPQYFSKRSTREMGKINSRAKGSRGERDVAKILREHGYEDARRTVQYCGSSGEAADVIGIPGMHLEIKWQERMALYKWYEQAVNDSKKSGNTPLVIHKQNNKPWLVSLSLEDFLNLINHNLTK